MSAIMMKNVFEAVQTVEEEKLPENELIVRILIANTKANKIKLKILEPGDGE